MSSIMNIVDIFLHLYHICPFIWINLGFIFISSYLSLFFAKQVVIMPFLPGGLADICYGSFSGNGLDYVLPIYLILCIAAILGDTLNYSIGHFLRDKVASRRNIRFIKREYIDRTSKYFEKHGSRPSSSPDLFRSFGPLHRLWLELAKCLTANLFRTMPLGGFSG